MNPDEQPSETTTPSRNRMIGIFGGLAVLGMVIGVTAAELTDSTDDSGLRGADTAWSPTPGPDATGTLSSIDSLGIGSTDEPTATPEATDSATATPTPTPTATSIPDYRPIPEDPASEPGLDFGLLTRVINQDGIVTLQFDRASFFTGEEAKERNQGKAPENDYLIENTNTALRLFRLDPQASIVAHARLLDQPDRVSSQILTVAGFVQNTTRVLTESPTALPVWVRHTDGLDGPITALAEQYVP